MQTDINLDVKSIKRKTIGGAMSFFVRTLILNGVGLAANLILGGLLMVADFGIYGVVVQIIGVLSFFSDIGLASALIQKKEEPTDQDYQTIFWAQMTLAGLIVGICWLIVKIGFFAQQLGEQGPAILYALAFSFVIGTMKTVPSIKLTRGLNFSKFVWPQIVEQVVFNGVLIYLVIKNMGLQAYTIAIWARSIAGSALMMYLVPFWPKLSFSWQSFKKTIRYGCKFQANDLLARIKDQLFYLFIAKKVTLDEFGYISFAKNWSMYPYNLTVQNVMAITFPTFSRLQEHQKYLRKAIEKSIFFITLMIFPILTGMCVFFWPLTQVITKYNKWEEALLSFVFFTLAIAPAAISSPLTNVLNAIGKINKTLALMVFWTILTWVLTLPLLKMIGYNAVAVSAFVISLTSFLPVIIVKKTIAFNLWEQIWRQFFASLMMAIFGLAFMGWWASNLQMTIIGGLSTGLIYVLTLLLVGKNKLILEFRSLK